MRFSFGCLAVGVAATQAFQLLSPSRRTLLRYSSNNEVINHFHNDDEEQNPRSIRVEEIKAELDAMNCNYGDCFDRNQLEQRLVQARDNPGRFSNNPSSSGQIFGKYEAPADRVGMRSTETKFEGLQQNIYAAPKEKKTVFFGELDDTNIIETEGQTKNRPASPSDSPSSVKSPSITTSYPSTRSADAGQSLYGSGEKPTRASDNQSTSSSKRQTIFGTDTNDSSGFNLEESSSNKNANVYGSNRPTQDTNRWSTFEGIKTESGAKPPTKTNQPSNIPNRWSTFEGIRTETPNNPGIHLEPPNARNQRLKAEPTQQQPKQQRPTSTFQNLNLEEPAKKQYKRSIESEKQKYNSIRDFGHDQQPPGTKFYHGIQVEDAPNKGAERRPTRETQNVRSNESQPNQSNASHGGNPMQTNYDGMWGKTVGDNDSSSSSNPSGDEGPIPGSMDTNNRH